MLREGDSYAILKFKQSLVYSDCDGVFADDRRLSVLIRKVNGTEQLFVEVDTYNFADPKQLPGFKSFQLKPEEVALRDAEAKRQAEEPVKPKTYAELSVTRNT